MICYTRKNKTTTTKKKTTAMKHFATCHDCLTSLFHSVTDTCLHVYVLFPVSFENQVQISQLNPYIIQRVFPKNKDVFGRTTVSHWRKINTDPLTSLNVQSQFQISSVIPKMCFVAYVIQARIQSSWMALGFVSLVLLNLGHSPNFFFLFLMTETKWYHLFHFHDYRHYRAGWVNKASKVTSFLSPTPI